MRSRKPTDGQFDLFVPILLDFPLKDQRETMERPFFSLQKRKRLKPIDYTSPDGAIFVKVEAVPAYGIATIWDADILIWASSAIQRMKAQRINELPRVLKVTAFDLLKSMQRDTGGKGYKELHAALDRLQTTTIWTSIRAENKGKGTRFSWIDAWSFDYDAGGRPTNINITLSDWIYEGIINEKSVLTIHPDYFQLQGGLERAVYRIARKHAGDQETGWTCRLSLLQDKTGSDSSPKEFARMMKRIADSQSLPEYQVTLTTTVDNASAAHFVRRSALARAAARAEIAAEEELRLELEAQRQSDPFAHRRVVYADD